MDTDGQIRRFSALQVRLIKIQIKNDDIRQQKFDKTNCHTAPYTTGHPSYSRTQHDKLE
jgi:hypothetical protein